MKVGVIEIFELLSCNFQLVQGTGPSGIIRAQDVEGFVPTAAAPAVPGAPPPTPVPGATYTDIPLSNVRKVFVI